MKYSHFPTPAIALAGSLLCVTGSAFAADTPAEAVDASAVADMPATSAPGSPRVGALVSPAARPSRTARAALQYFPTKSMSIPIGEITMLPVDGKVIRLALGSGAVLSTTTVDSNLLLIAEQPGTTTLMVWTNRAVHSYRITVVPKSMAETRAKVELLTRGMNGITLEQIGAELVLSGVAHSDELKRLGAALGNTPGIVMNVREDQGSQYTRSVLFRLHFVEVKKSLLRQLGIQWSQDAAGPTFGAMAVPHSTGVYGAGRELRDGDNLLDPNPPFVRYGDHQGGVFLGLATTITSRLRFGASNGDVRVLSSPELTAKSGGRAELQVGGQVPIPLAGGLGTTTVQYKDYGVIMKIAPTVDANGVITASVQTELSQIDPAVTVAGVPGFLRRSTSTEVSLMPGEMVALAGLVNRDMSDAVDRVPGLSNIPILGRLFRSDDYRNNKSELVVLLEPEIIQPGDGLARQLRERGQGAMQEFEEKAEQRDIGERPAPVTQPTIDNDNSRN